MPNVVRMATVEAMINANVIIRSTDCRALKLETNRLRKATQNQDGKNCKSFDIGSKTYHYFWQIHAKYNAQGLANEEYQRWKSYQINCI